MLCPKCNAELGKGITNCFVCGADVEKKKAAKWVMIGHVTDKISADFAHETLEAYDIPSVVFSRSGMFGNAGLAFTSFFESKGQFFEISVPDDSIDEAKEIIKLTIGDNWVEAKTDDEN